MRDTLIEALKTAGEVTKKYFGKVSVVTKKEIKDQVFTEADLATEKAIVNIISKKFPNHKIITEEQGEIGEESEFIWIIDPIDGSSDFAAGVPWYGVMIGLLKDFETIMGGIYLPQDDELYFAEAGKGATLNGKPIHATEEERLENVLFSYHIDWNPNPGKTEKELDLVEKIISKVRNLRTTNSCVDDCYVACGKFGGSANQTMKIWDAAAPAILVQETGGVATDIFGKELNFNVPKETNFTILLTTKRFHPQIIKMVRAVYG